MNASEPEVLPVVEVPLYTSNLPVEPTRSLSVGDDAPSAVTLKARAVGLSPVP